MDTDVSARLSVSFFSVSSARTATGFKTNKVAVSKAIIFFTSTLSFPRVRERLCFIKKIKVRLSQFFCDVLSLSFRFSSQIVLIYYNIYDIISKAYHMKYFSGNICHAYRILLRKRRLPSGKLENLCRNCHFLLKKRTFGRI